MKIKNLIDNLRQMFAKPETKPAAPVHITAAHLGYASAGDQDSADQIALAYGGKEFIPLAYAIQKPELMPGVRPVDYAKDEVYMATDSACGSAVNYAASSCSGPGFPGYPYLAQLAQLSEYRSPSETTAMEMTRKWIKLVTHGDGDKAKKMEALEKALVKHGVRDMFRRLAELDGFFGHGQLYIKIRGQDEDERRNLPLIISPATIKKGDLLGFKVIEPLWTTPYAYNTDDPAADDFYKPRAWFVLGKQTHASRLLSFISRPVPDILKPAYNFSGMSLSQLMEPSVLAWLRNRNSVADLVDSFSMSGLKTNMAASLALGGAEMFRRIEFYNKIRKNRGLLMIDQATEEFFQFNAPLSGLDKLQAQAQEHMAAPSHTPLVKLFGITPTGLNASAEGELDVYDDYIAAMQENLFRENLTTVLEIVQLDLFGEIDEAIGFEFIPMKQLDGTELAQVRKSDADAAVGYINAGVLSPEEERARLASDPHSGYTSIDVDAVPDGTLADPDEKPDDGMGEDMALDGEHWITLEGGSKVLIDENGNVLGGAGGKLNGKKLSPKTKSANRINEKTSMFKSKGFKSEPKKSLNLSDEQRNRIAKSEILYQKYAKGDRTRGEWKESARSGEFDHYFEELEQTEKRFADERAAKEKAENQAKNEKWRKENLPRLAAAKQEREEAQTKRIAAYKDALAKPASERTYLNVPYAEKDYAKSQGALWDKDKKKWFVAGEVRSELERFKPVTQQSSAYKPASAPTSASHSKLPKSGRIDEDDASIYGHELLGHEGESWNAFLESQAGKQMKKRLGMDEVLELDLGDLELGWDNIEFYD